MSNAILFFQLLVRLACTFGFLRPTSVRPPCRIVHPKNKDGSLRPASRIFSEAPPPILYQPSMLLPRNEKDGATAESLPPPSGGIIFVDSFSEFHSGYMIGRSLLDYGVGVVEVLSPYTARGLNNVNVNVNVVEADNSAASSDEEDEFVDRFTFTAPLSKEELSKWLQSIPFSIVAVVCESDSGLDYAEKLAAAIHCNVENKGVNVRHNGYLTARRDKFEMNEMCHAKGIQTVRQVLCSSVQDAVQTAVEFGVSAENEDDGGCGTSIIIKPRRSVASDRVSLNSDLASIETSVHQILGYTVFGTYDTKHDSVLLQEFVEGTEYVIDTVSKNGVHKAAALWVYDKTSTSDDQSNPFAYVATKLISSNDPNHPCVEIMDYVDHASMPWTFGSNAMDMCLSAYLDDDVASETNSFQLAPRLPTLQCSGLIVHLACFVDGRVLHVNHVQEIQQLDSTVVMEMYPEFDVGKWVKRTKDIRTDCGWVHLIHDDEAAILRDYSKICELMPDMFDVKM